jgi:glycosyltransferase involved in cell wall biosynthesis
MRVLSFTSLFPNASQPLLGIFIQQRVAHFAKRSGNLLKVVAPVPYVPASLPEALRLGRKTVPRQEEIAGVEVHHPRYPLIPKVSMPFHGLAMFAATLPLVRRLHKDVVFDCVDAHYVYPDGFAGVLLAECLGIPAVVSARGTDMNLFPSFLLIRPMIRWTLKRAAGTIGVCRALRDAMVELGASAVDSEVIGNGIDLERFSPIERQEARLRLGIPTDALVIVSVGALIPRKGYHLLVSAFAEIKPRYPNLRLYIIGEGESRSELTALIGKKKINDRVFLIGSKPNCELKYWYSAANVSCLTSSREGWANVLLESMACGTPVVATRVWGSPEVIASAKLGILVDQTKESIAQGLEQSLERAWDYGTLVQYARSRSWDVVAEEVESFLARVVAERPPIVASKKP